MSDEDLRALERDAHARNDSASWKRYYAARRRTGWSQPAGERAVVVVAPMSCVIARLQVHVAPDKLTMIREVELEWKRCATLVPIVVREAKRSEQYPLAASQCEARTPVLMAAPWDEARIYLTPHERQPRPDNTTIPHDWIDAPGHGPLARFCRGCRTLDTMSSHPDACIPEAHGLNVEIFRLEAAHVTLPEFLPDPMIMVKFTSNVLRVAGTLTLAGVPERIPRVRGEHITDREPP